MKKRILILSANPKDTTRLRIDEEVEEIQKSLERSKHREAIEVVSRLAVRVDDLIYFITQYAPTVVHFSGHGLGTDGIILENASGQTQLVSTESLAALFDGFRDRVECVLLNACYSEAQAKAIYNHINCIIGMIASIEDGASVKFSKGFYDALFSGESYKNAFELGCRNIELNSIPQSSIPVIKIRKDIRFIEIEKTTKLNELKMIETGYSNTQSGEKNVNHQGNNISGKLNNNTGSFNNNSGSFTVS
jgi:hypothetical protein